MLEMPEELKRLFQKTIKPKKPPVKIADLSPELQKRWREAHAFAMEMARTLTIAKSKHDGMMGRLWADINDTYNTHDRDIHIFNGGLYQGLKEEALHLEKDETEEG